MILYTDPIGAYFCVTTVLVPTNVLNTTKLWIGLRNPIHTPSRSDLFWYRNAGMSAYPLTFGSDWISGGTLNYATGNECYTVNSPAPNWQGENCNNVQQALCEIVCDPQAAIPNRK